ncbi:MAG: ATPase, T2SS/T4P/T4SS family, partial [Candidatus Micrarchaeaceae archaeon]
MLKEIMNTAFWRRQPRETSISASMSYRLEKDFPDKVIAKSERNGAVIGRKGSQMLYSVFCPNLSGNDEKAMAKAKASAVDSLVSMEGVGYSREGMELATRIAMGALGGSTDESKSMLAYLVANDIMGYGPLSVLLDDSDNIEEIVVNSPTERIGIYHSVYGYCRTNMRFATEADFRFMVNKLISFTERELNDSNPVIDAEIQAGSRLHAQIRPYAVSGAAASIRIGGKKNLDLRRLMELNTATPEILAYLWLAISARCNIIISGAPSSGKTTLRV